MLKVAGLQKVYGRKKKAIKAVDDVSFTVGEGELVGLLGPNGAGKTSIVKMICGLVQPDAGTVEIGGRNAWKERRQVLKSVSAVLEGNRNIFWPLTVRENMEYFAAVKGYNPRRLKSRIHDLVELLNLQDKTDVVARNLSRGMQQKLALGVALVSNAPLLVMDEPTLGLDVQSAAEIRQVLRDLAVEKKKTIIITSHDLHLVKAICPRTIIINKGRLVTDDLVENLLNLFSVRSYRLEIASVLSDLQKERLLASGHLQMQEKTNGQAVLVVNLEDPRQLYEIMDILRESEAIIESIHKQEVDLEEVFLQIVERGVESA